MPRTTVFGWYDDNIFGAVERVNDHVAVPPPHEPRQRYWRIIAKRADPVRPAPKSGRSCSAAMTCRAS